MKSTCTGIGIYTERIKAFFVEVDAVEIFWWKKTALRKPERNDRHVFVASLNLEQHKGPHRIFLLKESTKD